MGGPHLKLMSVACDEVVGRRTLSRVFISLNHGKDSSSSGVIFSLEELFILLRRSTLVYSYYGC